MAATSLFKKVTVEAKKLQKAHPKLAWKDAMSKAWKMYRSGKVAGVKKKAPSKVSGAKKVSGVKAKTVGRAPVKRRAAPVAKVVRINNTAVARGEAIIKEINRLEVKYKAAKDKFTKEFYRKAINSEHDKLDKVTKKQKRA